MHLTKADKAMQKAQSEGYDSASITSAIPVEYDADAGLKSAWDYGRALGDYDLSNRRFKPTQAKQN